MASYNYLMGSIIAELNNTLYTSTLKSKVNVKFPINIQNQADKIISKQIEITELLHAICKFPLSIIHQSLNNLLSNPYPPESREEFTGLITIFLGRRSSKPIKFNQKKERNAIITTLTNRAIHNSFETLLKSKFCFGNKTTTSHEEITQYLIILKELLLIYNSDSPQKLLKDTYLYWRENTFKDDLESKTMLPEYEAWLVEYYVPEMDRIIQTFPSTHKRG